MCAMLIQSGGVIILIVVGFVIFRLGRGETFSQILSHRRQRSKDMQIESTESLDYPIYREQRFSVRSAYLRGRSAHGSLRSQPSTRRVAAAEAQQMRSQYQNQYLIAPPATNGLSRDSSIHSLHAQAVPVRGTRSLFSKTGTRSPLAKPEMVHVKSSQSLPARMDQRRPVKSNISISTSQLSVPSKEDPAAVKLRSPTGSFWSTNEAPPTPRLMLERNQASDVLSPRIKGQPTNADHGMERIDEDTVLTPIEGGCYSPYVPPSTPINAPASPSSSQGWRSWAYGQWHPTPDVSPYIGPLSRSGSTGGKIPSRVSSISTLFRPISRRSSSADREPISRNSLDQQSWLPQYQPQQQQQQSQESLQIQPKRPMQRPSPLERLISWSDDSSSK